MRDPERIKRILDKLSELWLKNPDYRLGQLIENLSLFPITGTNCFMLWFQEDDRTEEILDLNLRKRLKELKP